MEYPSRWPVQLYTVSQLTSRIREAIYKEFKSVLVEGEISNLKLYPSGHLYFTLKDDAASLKAVMFNFHGRFPEDIIKDGTAVICRGRVDVYEKRGEYRLLVDDVEVKGLGLLQIKFEMLKEKLFKEGIFDAAHKRPLPLVPTRIGIVTSPAGAAIRDMLKIIYAKIENIAVVVYPARVQGDDACYDIVEGIEYFNREKDVDVIIVGRGGGSLEDLACFNEEVVARAIYASQIPIVSAVGHEIDFTIADFAADVRAPTPTAAADMVVREKKELLRHLAATEERLRNGMRKRVESLKLQLYQGIVDLKERKDFITRYRMYVDELSGSLTHGLTIHVRDRRVSLEGLAQRLNDLNPLNILKRGYSITTKTDTGQVVTDAAQAFPRDKLTVALHKGRLNVVVTKASEP